MKNLTEILESCSPRRRALVEKMLEREGVRPPSAVAKPNVEHVTLSDTAKEETRRFYDSVSDRLDDSMFGATSYFLNLGYVENDNPQDSLITLPPRLLDRNSIKLVLETVGDVDVTGARVLDVGCGRGGTILTITKYFRIAFAVGVDLSSSAIAFCRGHRKENARFIPGDAESLPLMEGAFDVVTNVESSHSYPDLFAFYREVRRVLGSGGYFLYADVFPDAARLGDCLQYLEDLEFSLERNQDITLNVLASCDEVATRRLRAFGDDQSGEMSTFLSAPGSALYEGMERGLSTFRILRLRRR